MPSRSRPASDAGPHLGGVLADAGGEDDASTVPEHGVVGADVLAEPVAVDVEGERGGRRRPSPAGCRTSRKSLSPAQALQPDCAVEQRRRSRRADQPSDAVQVADARAGSTSPERVPITRPSSGVRPIEVSTDRAAADGGRARRRCRGAARSRSRLGRRRAEQPRRPRRETYGVRGAVEAVAADAVRPRATSADRVGVRAPAAASGGTRCRRPRPAAGRGSSSRATSMPVEVGRVVQRRQRHQLARSPATTSSSISVGAVKRAPPCTTRWPTATTSTSPRAGRAREGLDAARSASSCVANGRSSRGSPPAVVARRPVGSPIRSTRPGGQPLAGPAVDQAGTSATRSRS